MSKLQARALILTLVAQGIQFTWRRENSLYLVHFPSEFGPRVARSLGV
jgi:hypothetical protein